MNKTLVRNRFAMASDTYDQQAKAQKQITNHLSNLIASHLDTKQSIDVFEFGCGTGELTKAISDKFDLNSLITNDITPISKAFETKLEAIDYTFIEGDVEGLDLGQSKFDLIAGASVIQWLHDIPAFLDKCNDALRTGGILAFSTFLPTNLLEIRNTTGVGLKYLPIIDWLNYFADYEILECQKQSVAMLFDNPKEVLRHLKLTGVTGLINTLWTPRRMYSFIDQYKKQYSQGHKVQLTYVPLYIILKKK